MIEYAGLVLLGAAVGTFGTLVGAGGGFVLVPVLLLVYPDYDPAQVTAMSLWVVFANASSGSVAYARQRRIDYRSGLLFALATLPGAVAGTFVVGLLPRRAFAALFAGALGILGSYLVLRRRTQHIREPLSGRGVMERRIRDRTGVTFTYSYRLWQGMAISVAVGFVSTLLGIGGGIIHVPIMAIVLRFPVHIATATSHFVLAGLALEGSLTHFASGELGWDEPFARASLIALGAIPGAQIGARLAHRIPGHLIIRALAAALILVALRLAFVAGGA